MQIISMLAGAVVALALAVLIYTQRHRLNALRHTVSRQATHTRERLTRGAEASYREAVASTANGFHLAGHLVPLERIAVVPRFFTPGAPFNPLDEDNPAYDDPLNLLPIVPDWPQVLGPYHLPGVPITQLLRGESPGVVLLGAPGSGRTVALALLALLAARQTEADQEGGIVDEPRIPIYLHLADAVLEPDPDGGEVDPLSPLLEAARPHLRGLAARLLLAVQGEVAAGRGLILVDGWDEIPASRQPVIAAWLQAVLTTYPGNRLAVAAAPEGYGLLQDIGLTPVTIMPWSSAEHAELASRWAEAWPEIGGTAREPASPPSDELVRRAVRGSRGRSPLDATLRIWATYAIADPGVGQIGWYRAYLQRVMPAPDLMPFLHRLAVMLLERPDETGIPFDEVSTLADTVADTAAGGRPSLATPDLLYTLTSQTRLLAERAGRRVTFTHRPVAAYLAAEGLRQAPFQESLLERRTLNRLVLPFLAQLQDITPYVEHRLSEPPTITGGPLLEIAIWAADADMRAPWRSSFFKRLASRLIGPAAFPDGRERALAALVASRDSNVAFIFREGLRSPDPLIRRLCVLGMGALGDPELVAAVGEQIEDPDPTVEVAAGLALGAVGTKTALNYMIQLLLTGGDLARRAAAGMLGATNLAGEGHDVLRDAADEQDPATRRAAIFGLERADADWAYAIIAGMEAHDDQWTVRAAASNVMDRVRAGRPLSGPPARPLPPDEMPWLSAWLAGKGEAVAPGAQGISQLVRALQEGDEVTRLAAAEALGALGAPGAVRPLYAALRDEHPEIREAAHRALGAISCAVGRDLPGVL